MSQNRLASMLIKSFLRWKQPVPLLTQSSQSWVKNTSRIQATATFCLGYKINHRLHKCHRFFICKKKVSRISRETFFLGKHNLCNRRTQSVLSNLWLKTNYFLPHLAGRCHVGRTFLQTERRTLPRRLCPMLHGKSLRELNMRAPGLHL